jgi:ribonuclease Z
MRLQLVFLGTGSTTPTPERNHSALHLMHGADRLLFDCGEGTQRQIAVAGLSVVKVKSVFITHLHGDHVLGLPGFLLTCQLRDRKERLRIYGPEGTKRLMKAIEEIVRFNAELEFPIEVTELKGGVAEHGDGWAVTAFPVEHDCPALGYAFQEEERANIDEAALRKIGLDPGPEYRELKAGKAVEWEGRKLDPKKYVHRESGLKVVYSGDCTPCETTLRAADNADLLVHEATFAQDIAENAREYKHTTARDAAKLARQANVKQLILTHFSTRYKPEELHKLLEDAKKEFENTVIAKDFMKIEL